MLMGCRSRRRGLAVRANRCEFEHLCATCITVMGNAYFRKQIQVSEVEYEVATMSKANAMDNYTTRM